MWSSRVGEVCIVSQYKVGMEGRVTDLLVSQGIGRWRGGADKFKESASLTRVLGPAAAACLHRNVHLVSSRFDKDAAHQTTC